MAKRRLLCAILALSLALAISTPPCRAETALPATSAPPQSRPTKQPSFCFQGAAPDQQEASQYADRAQRDASRASEIRAGDRDETAFIIEVVIIGAAVFVGGLYLSTQGL
jgi:hypothetical protein